MSEMSNIIVPIDVSNLSEAIPEGEDVIYSCFCRVAFFFKAGNDNKGWDSHFLATKNGIAINLSLNENLALPERAKRKYNKKMSLPQYIKWCDMKPHIITSKTPILKKKIQIATTKFQWLDIGLSFDKKYETKAEFKERKKNYVSY